MKKLLLSTFFMALFAFSCGNKTEENVRSEDTMKLNTTTQTDTTGVSSITDTTQNMTDISQSAAEKQKLEEDKLKKEAELKKKKEEEAKKKKEAEEKKKKEDELKNENTSSVDFSAIWKKRCVKCHGSNGKGKVEGVPDLTSSKTKSKSDKQLYNIISNGVKGETEEDEDMPSFKNKLTEEEINAAIKHVKGL